MKSLKSKKKKLALTSFYYFSQEISLGDSWKLIYIDKSRFYNFSHSWQFKNVLQNFKKFWNLLTMHRLQAESPILQGSFLCCSFSYYNYMLNASLLSFHNHVLQSEFLMIEQILLSPQVKPRVIISNKLVCTSSLTSCLTT